MESFRRVGMSKILALSAAGLWAVMAGCAAPQTRQAPISAVKQAAPIKAQAPKKEYPHQGRYWYFFDNIQYAKGDKPPAIRLWVALPLNRPGQKITMGKIHPPPTEILHDPLSGNKVAYWHMENPPQGRALAIHFDFSVVNEEIVFHLDPAQVQPQSEDSALYKRYTIKEPWLQWTLELEQQAREIVGQEINPLKQARLVYDWVVENVTYDYPHVKDRGVKKGFAKLKGDCGEFSHIFIAMMRYLKVPTRTVTCVWYQGGGHAWAEMFIQPFGWIPVDTSGAQLIKNGLKGQLTEEKVKGFMETRGVPTRDPGYLFGNLYPNRLEVFVGKNVPFTCKKDGQSRTFQFMQPGGMAAWPPSVEVSGLSKKTVHGGFFVFGQGAASDDVQALAEEKLAPSYLAAKLYPEARRGLLKKVARKPNSSKALFQLGQVHFGLNEYAEAVKVFTRSIAGKGGSIKRTTDTWSHIFIGMCHDALGDRKKAVAAYEAAIKTGADYSGSLATARKLLKSPYKPDKKK